MAEGSTHEVAGSYIEPPSGVTTPGPGDSGPRETTGPGARRSAALREEPEEQLVEHLR